MQSLRSLFAATVVAGITFAAPVLAADTIPYTAAAFDTAQSEGRSILVDVHAPWCPTCKAQEPILSSLQKSPAYEKLVVFRVDFDSQKDALRRFGVRTQSTLITFKGKVETGRSVGDTNPESIAALFAKAL